MIDDGWSHSASAKDWKPYYRPSSKYYTHPSWKYDDQHEYTDGTAWFRDSSVDNYPEYFTSFAVAYASPDTIINNNQTAVPGLPGGFGTFAFGLNSVDDVICYVSPNSDLPLSSCDILRSTGLVRWNGLIVEHHGVHYRRLFFTCQNRYSHSSSRQGIRRSTSTRFPQPRACHSR